MKTTITTNFTKTSLRVLRGLLLICLLAFTGTNQLNAQCNAMTGIVNIPDSAFKAYLVGKASINTNGDAEIQCSEAAAFTGGINVNNLSISSLTGIEAFINITALSCDNNPLGSLDVSHNTALTVLDCGGNNLTSLDVSHNTALTYFICSNNILASLDVSHNTALTYLNCYNDSLTSLDVSANTALELLYCSYNSLTSLDLSQNTALKVLNCYHNNLLSLDITHNTALTNLDCGTNSISSLDVSHNTALTEFLCYNNSISSLDVSHNTALFGLSCDRNNLSSLDVSHNTALTRLVCSGNSLSSLNVSANTVLEQLFCRENSISSLDISHNTALIALVCSSNGIINLDISHNTALTNLDCGSNSLSSLNLSANTALEQLSCDANSLTNLDISHNTALTSLECRSNSLTSLDVSHNTALAYLYCNNNNLTNLNVSHNTALTYFGCSFNSISRLDISHNTALTYLNCGSNSLTSLNLKNGNNANLTYLIADKNPNLSCIQVDNVANSNGYPSWLKDAGASYSTNCNPCTPTTSTTNLSICQSQLPYSWNGLTFTVAGTQTKTGLTNAKGCDSAATLNLSLKYEYPIGTSRVAKSTLCSIGATTTATNSNTLGGGVWTSSNPSIATATVAGNGANITAIANGVATLTYTKTAPTGCVSSASCMVTVVALSSPSAITGSSTVCKNATTALSTTTGGGIWSSQNGYAAISNTGIVTGLSAGTGVIKYTISNAAGCLASATYNISVIGLPAIPSIGYAPGTVNLQYGAGGSFCRGKTFTLVGTPTGGSWSSTGGITINATTGVATTNTVGAASVTYTVATSGCSNSRTISGTISTCAFRGVNNGQLTIDNLQFTMYPNPAKTFFNLNVDMLIGAGQIIVTDLYGKQLKTQPLSMGANTIDVSNLSKGMYFISTITNEGKATKKLVVE